MKSINFAAIRDMSCAGVSLLFQQGPKLLPCARALACCCSLGLVLPLPLVCLAGPCPCSRLVSVGRRLYVGLGDELFGAGPPFLPMQRLAPGAANIVVK